MEDSPSQSVNIVSGNASLWLGQGGLPVFVTDMAVRFPNDHIMAPPAYVRQIRAWACRAFTGDDAGDDRIRLRLIRQDHSCLRFGRSCIETPLRIGNQTYKRGLGTHANSEIEVEPPDGAVRFEAMIGVDNNSDTGGIRGTVEFIVEANGDELVRSPVLPGGAAPVPIMVRIGPDSGTLRLKVTDGGDGAAYDQADWADAAFVMADGSRRFLDEDRENLILDNASLPISFILGGRRSDALLATWARSSETKPFPGGERIVTRWKEPDTGFVFAVEAKVFDRYPAVEWVARFENGSSRTSPLIEDVRALDLAVASGYHRLPLVLHHLQGDTCSATSFMPLETPVTPATQVGLAPTGGRPSSMTAFPFWNLQYEDTGVIAAIGWTGQWRAEFTRAPNGPGRMTAGMEQLKTVLHPGESIRTPRILIMPWNGSKADAHVRFRRLMLDHYTPRVNGKTVELPGALQTFDRYHSHPDWPTEVGQLVYARKAADLGCDTVWLDAAWFPGGFPNGVGSWRADESRFPRGLKPVSDAVHEQKMRFVLWFEPERVAAGSDIAKEHPGWVSGGSNGGLFRLHDPEARKWLTELLIKRIGEYGVDVFRNDFNMDPLAAWRSEDAPDRQGMTEIRYVEGLYEVWDTIRARFPSIMIDNCSSGGRRLDLEMMMRSVPLWRSDTGCWAGHPEWNQMQSISLAQYLPLFTVGLWSADPYERRSAGTAGYSFEIPYLDAGFDPKPYADAVKEMNELRRYWYGDFYPIIGAGIALTDMAAWQLHRPDTGDGVIYCFRRPACGLSGIVAAPKGIKPEATYTVTTSDGARTSVKKLTGKQMLAGMVLRLPAAPSSLIVRYAEVKSENPEPGARSQGRRGKGPEPKGKGGRGVKP